MVIQSKNYLINVLDFYFYVNHAPSWIRHNAFMFTNVVIL